MPNLMDLPVELRGLIIDAVLDSQTTAPPVDPSVYPEGTKAKKFYGWDYASNTIVYRKDAGSYTPNSSILFAIGNRLLATETKQRLAFKRNCRRLTYAIDIILANESTLLPTWTHLPALTERVDNIYATVRPIGTYLPQPKSRLPWPAFHCKDGCPSAITWGFYSLLARFLDIGPMPPQEVAASRSRLITIGMLEIDVQSPQDLPQGASLCPPNLLPDQVVSHVRRQAAAAGDSPQATYMVHPEAIATYLQGILHSLLGMYNHTAPYGALLHERIGTIRVRFDGALQEQWDVAAVLASLPPNGDFQKKGMFQPYLGPPRGPTWRDRTWALRHHLGLPVLYADEVDGGARANITSASMLKLALAGQVKF